MSTTSDPTAHAYARTHERLKVAGCASETIERVFAEAQDLARQSTCKSEAIRLLRLTHAVGDRHHGASNGDEVWAIVRRRQLMTVMLRRSTQPQTPDAFKVQRVTLL